MESKNIGVFMHGVILSGYHDETGSVFHNRSPGASKIADHCRSNGWDIEVIDYVIHWDYADLENYVTKVIRDNNSKWIGISYTWLWRWENLKNIISYIKQTFPDILLIAGGQTAYNEDLQCDWYIYGYGEDAILKILNYEFNKGLPLIYTKRFNGKYVDAIHSYPSFNTKNYSISYADSDYLTNTDVVSVELSRGCKFKCSYCNYPFIGIKEDTSTSEEILYRELNENYERHGIKNYIVADDTPNDRTEKLIKLSNVVERLDFEPNFSGFIRADLLAAHPEQIELLAKSRFWAQYYGVETFNHPSGKSIGKGQDPVKTKETVLKVKEYFIKHLNAYRGTIGLIAGLPHESVDSMQKTQEWCEKYWKDQHWMWWPLQITLDQDSLSAFGRDFKKFGYRPLSKDRYQNKFLHKNSRNNFLWENDYTDIIEVEEFSEKYLGEFEGYLDSFAIISYVPFFGIEKSQTMKATAMNRYRHSEYIPLAQEKINSYIKNKCIRIT